MADFFNNHIPSIIRRSARWLLALNIFATVFIISTSLVAKDRCGRPNDFCLFLAPHGHDTADGLTEASPIRTLNRAHVILETLNVRPGQVRIFVAPGIFRRQSIDWKWTPQGTKIQILPLIPAETPIFDGVDNESVWFRLVGGKGENTNITIENLRIRNYFGAIWLHGNRARQFDGWSGGNTIIRNHFENIGSRAFDKSSTFAIGLINSRNNRIVGNIFQNITNLYKCGNMHSVYLAHGSSNNLIEGNEFDVGCGATISVRDASNLNVVQKNLFTQQFGNTIVLEWYCDSRITGRCTKLTPECPSWGTLLDMNRIQVPVGLRHFAPYRVYHDARTKDCRGAPSKKLPRIIFGNNNIVN